LLFRIMSNSMNDHVMIGEHQFHIPSLCAGGFRLAAAAAGCRKPYADELMQAWFQGFRLLLTESGGMNEEEAKEYLASLMISLLLCMSPSAHSEIVTLLRTNGSLDPETPRNHQEEDNAPIGE